jgi:molybdopterin-guanine dinucleotide biosynthesis protein A/molybdopterin converting factor small subunit
VTAIVLAGGRSSRMGSPKALLLFDREPLITHIVRRLQPLFDEIVVVAAPEQQLPDLPAKVVRDEIAFQGPVGGIYYGLRAARGALGFVTSCDSAFSSPPLISHLVSLAPGFDVVVPRWNDRLQPLHAVYRRTVLPYLEAQLADGELRPVFLYDKVPTRIVEENEIRHFDPQGDSFFNMNTPDDYGEAVRRWGTEQTSDASRTIACTVELLGVARILSGRHELSLALPPGATVADALTELLRQLPSLSGKVITQGRGDLIDGYTCNVNGLQFVKDPARTTVKPGDSILILSADAGG